MEGLEGCDGSHEFFRIDVAGQYLVTGILGDPVVRFTVRLAHRDRAVEVALAGARILAGGQTS